MWPIIDSTEVEQNQTVQNREGEPNPTPPQDGADADHDNRPD